MVDPPTTVTVTDNTFDGNTSEGAALGDVRLYVIGTASQGRSGEAPVDFDALVAAGADPNALDYQRYDIVTIAVADGSVTGTVTDTTTSTTPRTERTPP